MRRWIFQANPKHYDVERALRELDEILWRVPQYTGEVRPGDEVTIWRSGAEAGIVGVGVIASDPFESLSGDHEREFVLDADREGVAETRVRLKVVHTDYVPKDSLKNLPALQNHQIIRAPMGTVFPIDAHEWAEIEPYLSSKPPSDDRARSTATSLPTAFAWKDRRKDVYPMPGGYDAYLDSLHKVLDQVARLRPTLDQLNLWTQGAFDSSVSNARHIGLFLRRAGFVRDVSGLLEVSDLGHQFLESRSGLLVIAQLHSRIRFMGEMLDKLISGPASPEQLLKVANDDFDMGWTTKAQIQRRRGWLQSAGMIVQDDDGDLCITAEGRSLLSVLDLFPGPVGQTGDFKNQELTGEPAGGDAHPPEQVRSEVSAVAALIENLAITSIDSSNPDDFEHAVRDVFDFLGFRAEKLGGSGKTDVIADADLGRDDSYRLIIDGKTTARGAVSDGQIDWDTIEDHLRLHDADYAAIAAPTFGGDRLRERAGKHNVTLLTVGDLTDLVRLHAETPLGLDAYRELFKAPDVDPNLESLAESVEEIDRLTEVALAVLINIEAHASEVGAMTARDLFLLLRSNTELDAEEAEIELALHSLASPMIALLSESSGAFRPSGPRRTALMRMEILQAKFRSSR